MTTVELLLLAIALACFLIAKRLLYVVRLVKTMKVEFTIPVYGEDPDPENQPQLEKKNNVVKMVRRSK
jgi:hypothetical protein